MLLRQKESNMENLDNVQSSERVEVPKSDALNIQTKLPADTNVSKGQKETPINGVPEFNLVMRDQPEDKEYWARQAGESVKFGESADEFLSRTVLNPIHSSMFGSQSPQLSREELSDFGLDKAQKESIVATAGGNPKDYTDEDVYRATYPIDETKFGMSRANVMEASENEADYNINYNKAIQQELVDAGYDLGNTGDNQDGVDGIMGKLTRAAADEFQTKKAVGDVDAVPSQFGNGMPSLSIEEAQLNDGTINMPSMTEGKAMDEAGTKALQKFVGLKGSRGADGAYGKGTEQAINVHNFKATHSGADVDGEGLGNKAIANELDIPENMLEKIIAIESGGKGYDVMNTSSAAYGKYQFINSTAKPLAKELGFEGNDWMKPENQDKMFMALTRKNIDGLKTAKIAVDAFSVYGAHQQGLTGFKRIMSNDVKQYGQYTKSMMDNLYGKTLADGTKVSSLNPKTMTTSQKVEVRDIWVDTWKNNTEL